MLALIWWLVQAAFCLVYYGLKAVLFIFLGCCWGAWMSFCAALYLLTLGQVSLFSPTYDRAGKEHWW